MVRKKLAAARNYFRTQLARPKPDLDDAWFPWLIGFGLGKHVDKWFKAFGAENMQVAGTTVSSYSASHSASTGASGGWTGFGGVGASPVEEEVRHSLPQLAAWQRLLLRQVQVGVAPAAEAVAVAVREVVVVAAGESSRSTSSAFPSTPPTSAGARQAFSLRRPPGPYPAIAPLWFRRYCW